MIRPALRFAFVTFVTFMIFVLSVALARAQDTTGTILGTITDASGAVLPGVTVTVKNTDTSQSGPSSPMKADVTASRCLRRATTR